jgi:predicted peroxiredoxin
MSGKAVVSLTTGLEDPEKVTVAFLVAVAAAEQQRPTLMFLTKEAVRLAATGVIQGVACEGCPPLPELAKRYTEAGGRLLVCPVKTSTTCGSNCVPRRCLATATAASVPPARWKTSTTSASREVRRICSPLAPLGTPLPSQRSKVCSTLSLTRWGRPSRSPSPSAASQ